MAKECAENNDLQNAVDFLVPFTNILINLLSEKISLYGNSKRNSIK